MWSTIVNQKWIISGCNWIELRRLGSIGGCLELFRRRRRRRHRCHFTRLLSLIRSLSASLCWFISTRRPYDNAASVRVCVCDGWYIYMYSNRFYDALCALHTFSVHVYVFYTLFILLCNSRRAVEAEKAREWMPAEAMEAKDARTNEKIESAREDCKYAGHIL